MSNRFFRQRSAIFISYRHGDSDGHVGRLCDRLKRAVRGSRIFRDIDSIPYGVDFEDHINALLSVSRLCIVVIGTNWLNLLEQRKEQRDFVRIEICRAFQLNCVIIPVLVGNAKMPTYTELEGFPDIVALARINAIAIGDDVNFEHDFRRLLKTLNVASRKRVATRLAVVCVALATLGLFVFSGLNRSKALNEIPSDCYTFEEISEAELRIPKDDVPSFAPDLRVDNCRFVWIESRAAEASDQVSSRRTANRTTSGFYLQRRQLLEDDFSWPDSSRESKSKKSQQDKILVTSATQLRDIISRFTQQFQSACFESAMPSESRFRLPTAFEIELAKNSGTAEPSSLQSQNSSSLSDESPELISSSEDVGNPVIFHLNSPSLNFSRIQGNELEVYARSIGGIGMRLAISGSDIDRPADVYIKNKTGEKLVIVVALSGGEGKSLAGDQFKRSIKVDQTESDLVYLHQKGFSGWVWLAVFAKCSSDSKQTGLTSMDSKYRFCTEGWCHLGYLDFSILQIENTSNGYRFDSILFK